LILRDNKALKINRVAPGVEDCSRGMNMQSRGFGSDFATVRLRHYTAAFLPLIEGAYV